VLPETRAAVPAATPTFRNHLRIKALVGLWCVVMGAAWLTPGCYGHTCEGDFQTFGRAPGEGRLLSADVWESGSVDGKWLAFPRQRAFLFTLDALGTDRLPALVVPYVSAEADPMHTPGGNYTVAAGNLAEQSAAGNGQVIIKNGTCADYYLRVVVEASPRPPNATTTDGGLATSGDAGPDAAP
jgi:hypothetical protein